MTTKQVTVEHPEAHQAPHGALDKAREAEGIPEEAVVARYVNVSGQRTVYTLQWGEDEPERVEPPPAEPTPRGRRP